VRGTSVGRDGEEKKMAPWAPRLMLMSGSLGRRAATLPKWRCCVRWGRREAAMAAFAKNWRHPSACISQYAPPCGVGKMAKRKMLFHPDYVREKIRASQLINRLQKCAFGEISLTMTQLRAIEILLRKCIPDLAAAEIKSEQTYRYVVEIPAVLTREQWLEKYGKCDKESDLPDKPDRPLH
jgi:hypothetical protein